MEDEHIDYAHPDQLPEHLGDDVRETLETILEHKNTYLGWDRETGKVSESLCDLIHKMKADGLTDQEILDATPIHSVNTIHYHYRGDCTHEKRTRITEDECMWMRIKAHNGKSSSELSDEYDLTQENTTIHVTSKCSHDDRVEPIDGEELRSNAYDGVSKTTSKCPICKEVFEHRECADRTTCSPQCNVEYASQQSDFNPKVDN